MQGPIKIKSLNDDSGLTLQSSIIALKYLPKFFTEIRESGPKIFWLNLVARLISAFIPVAQFWVGKEILDGILEVINHKSNAKTVWIYIAIELALFILSELFSRLTSVTDGLLGDKYSNTSSVKLIAKTSEVELADLEDPVFYDKLNMARTQTSGRVNLMSNVLSQGQDIITAISLIVSLIYFEPWLILLLFISVLPSFINELKFSGSSYSLARSWTSERRELDYLRFIGANDKTAKEIKLFGLSDFIAKRFERLSGDYYEANKKLAISRSLWGFFFNVIGIICYYGAYILIIGQTLTGLITIGDLTFLSTSFNRLRNSLQNIFSRFTRISESALYLKDYYDFLNIEVRKDDSVTVVSLPKDIKYGFEFKDVHFKYPQNDNEVLKGINLHLKAGEIMAFVGENGSGKTTLIKLLLRFYQPTSGTIYLDGVDINDYDKEEYQQYFGVIFQDFVQYEFTVGENIGVGNVAEMYNESELYAAAEKSLAQAVVETFPKKFNQQLGKRFKSGKELSGGQWQKIALARAYMKNAPVIILDEPTSALDARAEYEAFQRFMGLTKGKTAVIISHRFSTVRMADRIMVLKDGVIIELGTHEELLTKEGLYAELFELQAQGYS
jgi:ATP-binding cassette, subfamily B, bacterial